MNRRKLKNRIAAQTARDRKKAKVEDMEEELEKMRMENEILRAENRDLKNEGSALAAENAELRRQLERGTATDGSERGDAFGSAASISAPLPKEQVSLTAPTITSQILLQLLTVLTTLLSNESSTTSSKTTRDQLTREAKTLLQRWETSLPACRREEQWEFLERTRRSLAVVAPT